MHQRIFGSEKNPDIKNVLVMLRNVTVRVIVRRRVRVETLRRSGLGLGVGLGLGLGLG